MLSQGHFGNHKKFQGLIELRWKNGLRVYLFMWGDAIVVAINGGSKNGQNKDINKAKKSATKSLREYVPFKSDILKDSEIVIEILFDCIRTGDLDSFREILAAHLMTVNKTDLAKKAGIGRRTIYDIIDPSKNFNPELSTISALITALAS